MTGKPKQRGGGTLVRAGSAVAFIALGVLGVRDFLAFESEAATRERDLSKTPRRVARTFPRGQGDLDMSATARQALPRARSVPVPAHTEPPTNPESSTPSERATLSGRVRDAISGPVIGARVTARSLDSDRAYSAVSDDRGVFGLSTESGRWRLTARADGYATGVAEVVSPARQLELVLSPGSTIEGRVWDPEAQQGVSGARVTATATLAAPAAISTALADAEGRFVLSGLSASTYDLTAERADLWGQRWAVAVQLAELVGSVEIEMAPAARLAGRVTVEGEPCSNATVRITGGNTQHGEADADGWLALKGLVVGRHELIVECPSALPRKESLDLTSGLTTRSWDLERGLVVRGVVETPGGLPVRKALVSLSPLEPHGALVGSAEVGGSGVWCLTDAQGGFSCAGLHPIAYECTLTLNGETMLDRPTIDLASGDSERWLRLRADPLARLQVRLNPEPSVTTAPISIFAQRNDGHILLAHEVEDGYSFGLLRLGSYRVYAGPIPKPDSEASARVQLQREGEILQVELPLPSPGSIQGRLVDGNGQGIPDIRISPRSPHPRWRYFAGLAAARLTDGEGFFGFDDLLPGPYQLLALDTAGHVLVQQSVEVASGAGVDVEMHVARIDASEAR